MVFDDRVVLVLLWKRNKGIRMELKSSGSGADWLKNRIVSCFESRRYFELGTWRTCLLLCIFGVRTNSPWITQSKFSECLETVQNYFVNYCPLKNNIFETCTNFQQASVMVVMLVEPRKLFKKMLGVSYVLLNCL